MLQRLMRRLKPMRRNVIGVAMFIGLMVAMSFSHITHWRNLAPWAHSDRPAAIAVVTAPSVNAERLWATLTVLSHTRYRETERAKIRDYLITTLESAGWSTRQQPLSQTVDGKTYSGVNIIAEPATSCSLLGQSDQARLGGVDNTANNLSSRKIIEFEHTGDDPGCQPDRSTLLVGAHYDAVLGSPGADDNGTGIAALLEIAHLFSPLHSSAPLKLVFFDWEEAGLWGSSAFVADTTETAALLGAIILEMLGYRCHVEGCQQYPPLPVTPPTQVGNFLAVLGDRAHPDLIRAFEQVESAIPIYTLSVPTFAGLSPDLLRSDHVPFWRQGIGAVMVTDTANFRNPHYHQESDRPDTLDPEFLTASTQVIVNAISQLLN